MFSDPILGCYGIGRFVDWLGTKFATKEEMNADSGVTAGSYGPTANATPEAGGSIVVPQVTVDKRGRVTGAADRTITLPAGGSGGGGGELFQQVYTTTLAEAAAGVEITDTDIGGAFVDVVVNVVITGNAAEGMLGCAFLTPEIEGVSHEIPVLVTVPAGNVACSCSVISDGGLGYISAISFSNSAGYSSNTGYLPIPGHMEYPGGFSGISAISLALATGDDLPAGTTITVYARKAVQTGE